MPPLAPLYPGAGDLAMLGDPSSRYRKLHSDDARTDQLVAAELLLGLVPPEYTDPRKVSELEYAVALQVQFQLDQGVITSQMMKTQSKNAPGVTTESYRDRYLHPGAAAIVDRVTERATVGFSGMPRGT